MTNSQLRRVAFAIPLLMITTLPGSARPSASRFDGAWSVVIVTDAGSCDRSVRYGVRIVGGRVLADGANVAMSGSVDSAGHVFVSLRAGESAANGSGRLSGSTGAGRWEGVSGNSRCSGRWQAQRGG
jgi:hypothetical protein